MTTTTNSRAEYQRWLDSPTLSDAQWQELNDIAENDAEIESRFYAPLEFGTAGLRGVMAVGLHCMNDHVIRHATQSFAEVIIESGTDACEKGVVICFDCREHSEEFAREAACVMAANGIHVRLFDALRPTPELSFAIRHFGAAAGINVTASHNTKEYNGYKVYWSDGAQLPPKKADEVAAKMAEIDMFSGCSTMPYEDAVAAGRIELIGEEVDEAFLACVMAQSIDASPVQRMADRLEIVYTPFHGAGYKLIPEVLGRLGVTKLLPVAAQMRVDGSFPTVTSPNPENAEGFALALQLAKEHGSPLIIGSDPDSDRLGVAVRDHNGEYVILSGNQVGVLLLDYILTAKAARGELPEKALAIKTIVTTEMAREVCRAAGVRMEETFTGFKFIVGRLEELKQAGYQFLMGYEESIGYLIGDFVRDKDAVTASMMVAEMTAWHMEQGRSLLDALDALYARLGYFEERTVNLVMPGLDGLKKMRALMNSLREAPPEEIAGERVLRMRDYLSGHVLVPGIGNVERTPISGSDVLYFELADGTNFIARPSGTEPKIKVYVLARGENRAETAGRAAKYEAFAKSLPEMV